MMRDQSSHYIPTGSLVDDLQWLQRELNEAQATIRQLTRQIEKEQAHCDEISQAYKRTVDNLMEIARQNNELERDRDLWRMRASATAHANAAHVENLVLSREEIGVIRRAVARLHHPDTGGDPARMQIWNATLDGLEAGRP